MAALSNGNMVLQLKNQYSGAVVYGEGSFQAHVIDSINNHGFMGARDLVFLNSLNTIVHEAPGCVAAPIVNMVATNAIRLGMDGQGSYPVPVRLYAPQCLSLIADHVVIGDLQILGEPQYGVVCCKKLTLLKSTEKDPPFFETVKSWVLSHNAKIEVISKAPNSGTNELEISLSDLKLSFSEGKDHP